MRVPKAKLLAEDPADDSKGASSDADRYRAIFGAGHTGIITWNLELKVVDWNTACYQMFGWTEDDARSYGDAHFLVPDATWPCWQDSWRETQRGGEVLDFMFSNRTRSGKEIECEWRNTPVTNLPGEVTGFVSLVSDVSRIRCLEDSLLETERRHRQILDSIEDLVLCKGPRSRIVWANRAFRDYYGMSNEELQGMIDAPFGEPDFTQQYVQDDAYVFSTGKTLEIPQEPVIRFDGEVRYFNTVKSAIQNEYGEIVLTIGVSRDITDRKLVEEEKEAAMRAAEEAQAEAERINNELVLATEDLRRTQGDLIRSAHRAGMAEIATSVLHNVGNVLNSVNVSANEVSWRIQDSKGANLAKVAQMLAEHSEDLSDFLTRDPKGQQLPAYLAKLAEALEAERRSIADELRQLSKSVDHIKDIVATQQSYAGTSSVAQMVQPRDLVEDALRMNAAALSRHDVVLIREYSEIPELTLDKHRILLILVNLISNAKYAADGITGHQHEIRTRLEFDQSVLKITVADNGIGIPAENLAKIFAHGFTTRNGGHGFGLHSCVIAAKEMGGELTAYSDGPGQGARFVLEIPTGEVRRAE